MKVEIYSDVVCPWCYIGERRFARALAEYGAADVEVVYRPFQLDPSAPQESFPLRARLEGKFGANAVSMMERVSAAAHEEGIEIDWDRGLAVNTLLAHRLLGFVEREFGAKVQRRLVEALFEAHFTKGRDVSSPVVLAEVAAETGIDRPRVEAFLASDEGASETRAELDAAGGLGIRAVPTFVVDGRYMIQGAQEPRAFVQAFRKIEGMRAGAG